MSTTLNSPSSTQLQDEQAIWDIFRKFEAAFLKSDIDTMLESMYERAVFAWGATELIGKEALREAFNVNMAGMWKDTKVVHNFNGIEFLSPDTAVIWGNAVVTMPDGTTQSSHIMNTLIKRDGRWLIASEQFCGAGE